MTSGSWGLWHDEISLDSVKGMPVHFPTDPELRERIVDLVAQLQNLNPIQNDLPFDESTSQFDESTSQFQDKEIMEELDTAIYDLYELGTAERDLIHELCTVGLDLFYRDQKSEAVAEVSRPDCATGTLADVVNSRDGLSGYLCTFMENWRSVLDTDSDLVWVIISPPSKAPVTGGFLLYTR